MALFVVENSKLEKDGSIERYFLPGEICDAARFLVKGAATTAAAASSSASVATSSATAAASVAASEATSASTAATPATSVATTPASATAKGLSAVVRKVHTDRPSENVGSSKLDSGIGGFRLGEFNVSVSLKVTGFSIGRETDLIDSTTIGKSSTK
mmetsp:Transcript_17617/g.40243  ORF Transcript_17617/g.40243 Transcript_17617/m.40243 type:complete len:156 (+) Transcript_17617:820-1287(+)